MLLVALDQAAQAESISLVTDSSAGHTVKLGSSQENETEQVDRASSFPLAGWLCGDTGVQEAWPDVTDSICGSCPWWYLSVSPSLR